MTTTIVLADDHPVVRQGVRAILAVEPAFQVVGETGDGLEAVRLTEKLQPNVLIVDMMMPGLTGLEVVRRVTQSTPQTHAVILSMYTNEAYVLEALRNGAVGYILKDSVSDELAQAVREVAAGRRYLSALLSERALEHYIRKADPAVTDAYELLTAREREVLKLSAESLNNPEIAERLCVSPRTVETHRGNLMKKLGLQNQTDLIRYALKRGLLPLDQ